MIVGSMVSPDGVGQRRGIVYRGERRTLADWCRRLGLVRRTVEHRLTHGWTVSEALERAPGDVPERLRGSRHRRGRRHHDGFAVEARP